MELPAPIILGYHSPVLAPCIENDAKKVAFLAHNRWCPDPENHHMFAIFLVQKPLMIALVVGEGV